MPEASMPRLSSRWARRNCSCSFFCSVMSCLIAMKWVISPCGLRTGVIVISSWYSRPALSRLVISRLQTFPARMVSHISR